VILSWVWVLKNMSNQEQFKAKACKFARSGTFHGWAPLEFVLRFEPGYAEAQEWLHSPETRHELDELCREAREQKAA
jgi:hypothetical protein